MRHLPDLPEDVRKQLRTAFRCPCSTVLMGADELVANELIRKQSLRRHENALRRQGQISFAHIEDRESIRSHLAMFFHHHVARRAVLGEKSHFLDERTRRVFETLVEELDPKSLLRFAVLYVDKQPIAFHFGFEANGKYILYQTAFSIDYAKCAPGEVLLRKLFAYARDRKLSELDMTRGGESYKDRFCNHIRENLTIHFNHDAGICRTILLRIALTEGALRKSIERLRVHADAYRFARNTAIRVLNFWRNERELLGSGVLPYASGVLRRMWPRRSPRQQDTAIFEIPQSAIASRTASAP
jgi:hypothetical protein